MTAVYMLDTNICSFVMRERPRAVLDRLQAAVERQDSIVISVVTYYEMLLGTIGRNASPRHAALVESFVARLSDILPWDRSAAEEAMLIRKQLAEKGTPIGPNDTMIAGHALAAGGVLVTNNIREFATVENLLVEDWAIRP
ncbi:type II toxin-antitoxin system VapC family toxin [Rhodoblastus acidophilus]|uniref:Ribonuclease VapC n=1 Tax=Candidatus Rhodoblastus alkanivorans TaxID=2954117 RepID=A0ABS9Z4J5_9HYPH|nr:type II toxin-antitoxin system VapC family toxin [Candidatus Rhodoblastus alkanivorans]MCI4677665.1 type II toxin-antitoxin system VapC family toxin [Candidatus Rhodoblastus alkanivorans]MCI4682603.1 type II toxin-antitoxin system VapC family toxin [Candidatus Rhodoblastus alkanivorans]MDI4639909.1 type II toxin-antitoxin system VapC family toxin [Rhodoblastus acidophilus]